MNLHRLVLQKEFLVSVLNCEYQSENDLLRDRFSFALIAFIFKFARCRSSGIADEELKHLQRQIRAGKFYIALRNYVSSPAQTELVIACLKHLLRKHGAY